MSENTIEKINDSNETLDENVDEEIRKEVKDKKNIKRNVLDVLFLVLVFGLTLYGVFRGENLNQVLEDIKQCDLYILIVPGIICVLAFIMLESVIFKYLFNTLGIKLRLTRCFLYSFVGFFFSAITPSASGGQPAQLIFMKKDKISVAHSTLVLLLVTIAYKLVLVVLGGITLIIRPKKIMAAVEGVEFWVWLGIILNVIIIAAMLILVYVPSLARSFILKCVSFLNKIRILKDKEKWVNKTEEMMEKYKAASKYLKTHKIVLFNAFLISIVQRVALFFVTVIVYWSFHLSGTSVIEILTLQCLISVGADMLPLPGGMGITERLFLEMFDEAFGMLVLPAMILSRGFSYYIQLLICAVMTVVAYLIVFKKKKRKKKE
ncbi:MAG: flippase-like domain-containing protein [Lachnospiraceae bacterium]|nr:flippase-like domain-containing protein [Lachnospiraceae bacterium]